MATLDTDFMRLHLYVGTQNIAVQKFGWEWPPPERIYLGEGAIRQARDGDDENFVMVRVRYSELDDETAAHPHIVRGAEYHYLHALQTGGR